MKALQVNLNRDIAEIQFATSNNTINHVLVRELLDFLKSDQFQQDTLGAILFGAGDRFFSPGFDLSYVSGLTRNQMAQFMDSFCELYQAMISCSKPLFAVLNGHALAGGFILATACSLRLAQPEIRIGFTEFTSIVGIPNGALTILSSLVGETSAQGIIDNGINLSSDKALDRRLIDHVLPRKDLIPTAREHLTPFSKTFKPRFEFIEKIRQQDQIGLDQFLDRWFSEKGQNGLSETCENLGVIHGG